MFTNVGYPQGSKKVGEIERLVFRTQNLTIASGHKGLILTCPIRTLDFLPDRVIFQAPEPLLCFTMRDRVFLFSHTLPEAVTARLLEINMVVEKISLSNLTFSGHQWQERIFERIQPRDPIDVMFSSRKMAARAYMKNLSTGGICLMISRTKDQGICTDHDSPIRLAFQLPRDAMHMDLKGKIVYSRLAGNQIIIGIQFHPTMSQEKRLNQYIQACKAKILDELECAFQKRLEPRQIQDLYF